MHEHVILRLWKRNAEESKWQKRSKRLLSQAGLADFAGFPLVVEWLIV